MQLQRLSLLSVLICLAVTMQPSHSAPAPEKNILDAPLTNPFNAPAPPATTSEPEGAITPLRPEKSTSSEPQVSYDLSLLPAPVAATRQALLKAAHSADLESFRPILSSLDSPLHVSFSGEEDPIAFWRENTGDQDGLELMAIMIEILNQGYVHLDKGSENEIYVWPYFFGVPLTDLSNKQLVELYMLITPQDADEMKSFGNYIFYRLGISPDGQWRFMVAGD
jgi:hypothetical protein